MVTREELSRGGRRAYELGRLRVAARAAWVLVPLALACAWGTGRGEPCACVGVMLLVVTVLLRWHDRHGVVAARDGLLAGGAPLVLGLVAARLLPSWAGTPVMSWCALLCLGLGLPSGVWLGSRLARRVGSGAPGRAWLGATLVAGLASSLGCVGFGGAGALGAAAGLTIGLGAARALA